MTELDALRKVVTEMKAWVEENFQKKRTTVTVNYHFSSVDCGVISADDIAPIDMSQYCDWDSGNSDFEGTLTIATSSNVLKFTCGSGYITLITDSSRQALHVIDENLGGTVDTEIVITIPDDGVINLSHMYY